MTETILLWISAVIVLTITIAVPLLLRRDFPYVFLLWFFQSTALFSVLALEYGAYITEQARYSFASGAAVRLALYNLLLFATCWLVLRVAGPRRQRWRQLTPINKTSRGRNLVATIMLSTGIAGLLLLFLNLLLTGIPALDPGITRFNYWRVAAMPWLAKVFGATGALLLLLLAVPVAIASTSRSRIRRVGVISFGFYLLYTYLIGHRFSLPFIALYYFALLPIVMGLRRPGSGVVVRRTVVSLLVGLTLILGITASVYADSSAGLVASQGSVSEAIWYRIAYLQGHTWWGADANVFVLASEAVGAAALLHTDPVYEIMTFVSPGQGGSYYENNIRFAVLYPAAGLYYFGPAGLAVMQVVLGATYAAAILLLEYYAARRWLVSTLLALFLLWRLNQLAGMADMAMVPHILLALGIVGVLALLRAPPTPHQATTTQDGLA